MFLQVDPIHNLHYETYGSAQGIPVIFIHGGPGLGYSKSDKRFFDPSKQFIIFYDQRGCGKSTPYGCLERNKPEYLIADIAILLDHLKICSIHVFGGSWGATLAILFAAKHPNKVKSLTLRGFFSATKSTIDFYLRGGSQRSHPNAWARVKTIVPKEHHENIAQYYFDKISDDSDESIVFAREWSRYGLSLSRKKMSQNQVESIMEHNDVSKQKIMLELHFALNNFFIEDGYVFERAELINTPTTIIHGAHDHLCPIEDAKLLRKKMTGAELIICNAGHSSAEVEIEVVLKNVTSNYS